MGLGIIHEVPKSLRQPSRIIKKEVAVFWYMCLSCYVICIRIISIDSGEAKNGSHTEKDAAPDYWMAMY